MMDAAGSNGTCCAASRKDLWPLLNLTDWNALHNDRSQQLQQGSADEKTNSYDDNHSDFYPRPKNAHVLHVLDVRSSLDHAQLHLSSSSSSSSGSLVNVVHIPLNELKNRRYELPPRHKAFAILMNHPNDRDQKSLLQDCLLGTSSSSSSSSIKSFTSTTSNENNDATINDTSKTKKKIKRTRSQTHHDQQQQPQQKPWNIIGILDGANPETWSQAADLGLLHKPKTILGEDNYSLLATLPQPRLWEPDVMVQDLLLPWIVEKATEALGGTVTSTTKRTKSDRGGDGGGVWIEIWDLGAGVGRDACFLAEELQHRLSLLWASARDGSSSNNNNNKSIEFRILAIDQRYRSCSSHRSLVKTDEEECIQFWNRRGVGSHVHCRCMDLSHRHHDDRGQNNNHDKDAKTNAHDHLLEEMLFQQQQQQHLVTGQDGNKEATTWSLWSTILVVYAVRFWNRSLVQHWIARELPQRLLRRQQPQQQSQVTTIVFAMSQFGKPSLDAEWNFDHPKEKHVLARNELQEIFYPSPVSDNDHHNNNKKRNNDNQNYTNAKQEPGESSWKIHHDRVVLDGDHGRTLIQFLAESTVTQVAS
ncbi:hypothetical protein ACA910_012588 [Epithemia clementina (nom. ined.)]